MALFNKPPKGVLPPSSDPLSPLHGVKTEKDIGHMHEHFGASWRYRNLAMEAENAFEHYYMFHDREKEPSVGKGILNGSKPAVIIGSGASLDSVLPYLKEWQGGIFCSTSHLSTLAYHDITPTYFACPDPRGDMAEFAMPQDKLSHFFRHTIMACAPIQPIEYTRFWQGMRRWYHIFDPTKEWYAQILRPVFNWVTDVLLPFSANVPALVAIAQYCNFAPIYLIGCDFSGARFNQWVWKDDKEWVENKGSLPTEEHRVMTYNGKVSSPNLMWAWRGLLCVCRLNAETREGKKWHIYNCGGDDSVLCDHFPHSRPAWLVRSQGRGEIMTWSKQKFIDALDLALCRFNTFVFAIHNGISYGTRVQIANSYEDLENQINDLNGSLEASRTVWKQLTPEMQVEIQKQSPFNPDLVKGIDSKAYMERARHMKDVIAKRDKKD